MIFLSEDTKYICISDCLNSKKMNVHVCESEDKNEKYYIWTVKDNGLARSLTKLFNSDKNYRKVKNFSMGELHCFVFPYRKERNVRKFAFNGDYDISYVKEIFTKIIFLCMTSGLPWEIVSVLISEDKINISEYKEVYFTFDIGIVDIESKNEEDIAVLLGSYLENLVNRNVVKNYSGYQILLKKNKRKNYVSLSELYQDIAKDVNVNAFDNEKGRISQFIKRHKAKAVKVLKILCVLIGIIAIVVFIGNTAFDSSPFYRLFVNTFKKIGTESMLH